MFMVYSTHESVFLTAIVHSKIGPSFVSRVGFSSLASDYVVCTLQELHSGKESLSKQGATQLGSLGAEVLLTAARSRRRHTSGVLQSYTLILAKTVNKWRAACDQYVSAK